VLCLTRPSPRRGIVPRRGRCETALPTSVGHHHIRATPRDRVVSATRPVRLDLSASPVPVVPHPPTHEDRSDRDHCAHYDQQRRPSRLPRLIPGQLNRPGVSGDLDG